MEHHRRMVYVVPFECRFTATRGLYGICEEGRVWRMLCNGTSKPEYMKWELLPSPESIEDTSKPQTPTRGVLGGRFVAA